MRAQGFIFLDNSRFKHGTLGVDGQHKLSRDTNFLLRYYFAPNLLVGEDEVRTPGEPEQEQFADEMVTTKFVAAGLSHLILAKFLLRGYGRYGTRRYNQEFQQRDTDFWTIGLHAGWDVLDAVQLMLGYHYERGRADGKISRLYRTMSRISTII